MKLVSMEVVGMDGYTYTVKKKVKYALVTKMSPSRRAASLIQYVIRVKDPLEPDYVRIPPYPVPLTWAKSVEPFSLAPPLSPLPPGATYITTNVAEYDLLSLGKTFVGVLLDVPWRTPRLDGPGRIDASQLVR